MIPHADRIAEDWTKGVDHGGLACQAGRREAPANTMLVHEVVAKCALGILGEPGPRWG